MRECDRLGSRPHLQLGENVRDVELDRALTDEQSSGDVAVAKTLHHQLEHLTFTVAKLGEATWDRGLRGGRAVVKREPAAEGGAPLRVGVERDASSQLARQAPDVGFLPIEMTGGVVAPG